MVERLNEPNTVVAINIGRSEPMVIGERRRQTGIYKRPVADTVMVRTLGLEGDVIADQVHHGGVDQAVYLYSMEDYEWWSETLEQEMLSGIFGENLTVTGFGTEQLSIGDQFQIGDVLLEVTAPRIPCATLATKMGDPGFVKAFRDASRPGVYTRVLQEGEIKAGDEIKLLPSESDHPSVNELFDFWYEKDKDPGFLERLQAAPVAERVRTKIAGWLIALE